MDQNKKRATVEILEVKGIALEMDMSTDSNSQPDWVVRGKTIRQLIRELQSFENQDLFVEMSLDGGETHKPISLVGKYGQRCLLVNFESDAAKDAACACR